MKKKGSGDQRKKVDNVLGWLTLILLVGSAVIGLNRTKTDFSDFKSQLWPEAYDFEAVGYETVLVKDEAGNTIGCVATSTYDGFGGPLNVAVALDTGATIRNIVITEHRETPSWYERVMDSNLISDLTGKNYKDPLELEFDVQGITGATYTARAITTAAKEAALNAAQDVMGYEVSSFRPKKSVKFELPEISLIGLFLVATVGIYRVPSRHKKTMKWILMVLSTVLVGFVFNHPLTLVDINKLTMGYWPDVYNQLYWYILIFGIIIIFLTTGKNTYCKYVCPFGAVQECMGAIGGAKALHSRSFTHIFHWTRKIVVLLTIMLALVYRNPGMSSYEVYGTLFNLLGTNFEIFFLIFVMGFALFVKRPWCNYLCPIPVIEQYARFIYKKIKAPFGQLVQKKLTVAVDPKI